MIFLRRYIQYIKQYKTQKKIKTKTTFLNCILIYKAYTRNCINLYTIYKDEKIEYIHGMDLTSDECMHNTDIPYNRYILITKSNNKAKCIIMVDRIYAWAQCGHECERDICDVYCEFAMTCKHPIDRVEYTSYEKMIRVINFPGNPIFPDKEKDVEKNTKSFRENNLATRK